MKSFKYKTNINCGGCVATVTPYLNNVEGVESWHVNTDNKDKILEVKGSDALTSEQIIQTVEEAGFHAYPADKGLFKKLFG